MPTEYAQFCPIAKSSELIGEKWTLLLIRELLMGGTRYSDFQRGLGSISPTLLSKRLKELEASGLIFKKKIQGQRGYEYFPTESCKELHDILISLGNWGMRWTRAHLTDKDYDVELLMLYLQRSILAENLPSAETIISFTFTDMSDKPHWWLVINEQKVDICDRDPGKDVDVYFNTSVKTMVAVWTSQTSYRKAINDGQMVVTGTPSLTKNIPLWMANSVFTDLPPAPQIL